MSFGALQRGLVLQLLWPDPVVPIPMYPGRA